MTDGPATRLDHQRRRMRRTAQACTLLIAGMVGMAYAAVPLYELFCKVTGFGGTTQTARVAPEKTGRTITVRFDSNTADGLAWKFGPEMRTMTLKVGEEGMISYRAQNLSDRRITGTATYNVTPHAAGIYFNKIQCFCFTEQALDPGQAVDMPVNFFVDPEILKDPMLKDLAEITLSYTFFPVARTAEAGAQARPAQTVN